MVKAKTKEPKNRKTEEQKNRIKTAKERLKLIRERIQLWRRIKWPVLGIGGFLILLLVSFGFYSVIYAKTTYRNVYVGGINLSGKKQASIAGILKPRADAFLASTITLKFQPQNGAAKNFQITPTDIGLAYDLNQTASDVFAVGRSSNVFISFYQQLKTFFVPYRVSADYSLNLDALNKKIADIAGTIDTPEKDYGLKYAGGGVFELSADLKSGQRVNQQLLISQIQNQVVQISPSEISFMAETYPPQISRDNAEKALTEANQILAAGPLPLANGSQTFSLDIDTIAGLIASRPNGNKMEIYIDDDKTAKQVVALAAQTDKPAGNAVLAAADGKVVVSSDSEYGSQLNQQQAEIDIENALLSRIADGETAKIQTVNLKVNQIAPDIDSAKLASYGLTELVASGTTNFYNSPANRVHNINVGAAAINGTLIAPGAEFSTLDRLGKIDASTGYLPELVIKNNQTVPDYGGGLCQVSTTLFRTALNAGMKITERQNHSYRVSYYEPPIGMDATIFDPAPDFKFVNNYSSYIFIQSKIVGTKITFEFYGTKDDRQVNIGQAVGYDYIDPPPAVETVDPTLAPGQRILVSHSHQGASAKFHYNVTRDGVVLQDIDFVSHYVALPEQWRVGPSATPTASPTPAPSP